MRTSEAQIKLVLKREVIYLQVTWKSRVWQSTGFKCPVKHWDAKNERVKKGFSNATAINYAITKLKNQTIERRDAYILAGEEYTSRMLLEEKPNNTSLASLINAMADERGLRASTVESYKFAVKSWGKDDIKSIDADGLKSFMSDCKGRGLADGTINIYFQRLEGLVSFAIEKGYIKENPFVNYRFQRHLKVKERHPALTKFQMDMCLIHLADMVELTGSAWTRLVRQLEKKVSKESIFGLFCFSYFAGGLAPIDCLLLRKKDITQKVVNGKSYYVAKTSRRKTGRPVSILIKVTPTSAALINALLETKRTERLFASLEGIDDKDEKSINMQRSYIVAKGQQVLRSVLQEVNERISRCNKGAELPEELIDIKSTTLYSARHTLASVLANSNVSLNSIASVMGRSVNGIGRYIKSLTGENEIADAVEAIY